MICIRSFFSGRVLSPPADSSMSSPGIEETPHAILQNKSGTHIVVMDNNNPDKDNIFETTSGTKVIVCEAEPDSTSSDLVEDLDQGTAATVDPENYRHKGKYICDREQICPMENMPGISGGTSREQDDRKDILQTLMGKSTRDIYRDSPACKTMMSLCELVVNDQISMKQSVSDLQETEPGNKSQSKEQGIIQAKGICPSKSSSENLKKQKTVPQSIQSDDTDQKIHCENQSDDNSEKTQHLAETIEQAECTETSDDEPCGPRYPKRARRQSQSSSQEAISSKEENPKPKRVTRSSKLGC